MEVIKIELLYVPATPLLGTNPKGSKSAHCRTCKPVFFAALFMIAKLSAQGPFSGYAWAFVVKDNVYKRVSFDHKESRHVICKKMGGEGSELSKQVSGMSIS